MLKILSITLPLMLVVGVFGCYQPVQPPKMTSTTDGTNIPSTGNGPKFQLDDPLIHDFTGAEWERVYRAEQTLERQPQTAVPSLVQLLDRDEHVKLQDTADLIYPGADTFYGHGWIINYDLDWLSVRAGWALEEITFQDFGFSERGINEDQLLSAVVAGKRDVPLDDVAKIDSDAKRRKDRRSKAVARAKQWWRSNGTNWNRLTALSDALHSDNRHCVLKALHWLRFGESPIDGFTRDFYIKDLYPVVQRLAKSQDEGVSGQAECLVDDYENGEWYWYQLKTDQDEPE